MKNGLLILLFCLECALLTAQSKYIPPQIPEKAQKTLNEALSKAATGQTDEATASVCTLIEKYPTWIEARHTLSRIFFDAGNKEASILALEQAIAIDTLSQLQQLYSLGRLYEESGVFEKALKTYSSVVRLSGPSGPGKLAKEKLKSLHQKVKLYQSTYDIIIKPFAEEINTTYDESLGRWTLDGRSMIFTRLIGDNEDIFEAKYDSLGRLKEIVPFSFNTASREGGHAISPDGKYLIFTSCNRNDGFGSCDLYLTVLKNGTWTKPVNMGPSFNTNSWDSQPCFGLDGKSIYFSSARPGGYGARDIWYVQEESPGKWSAPINAGPNINTTNNEASPFIHFDGRTMYFMRDGNEGLGKHDLYFSRLGLNQEWQVAENMGSPVSTPADEGALSIHPNGRHAIITRYTDQRRNDLFEFELPARFLSTPVQALEVTTIDATTQKPVRARLQIIDFAAKDTIRLSQTADETGRIVVTLDRHKEYGIVATAENYLMASAFLSADSSALRKVVISLNALETATDKTFILQNIFFETGSAKLLPASYPELKNLVNTLQKNPSLQIEISGHTDNTGSDGINRQLSEARAKSVYQYLIDQQIDATRLSYKGYGAEKPVATNETEEGRRQNRRTEFKIVKQ